MTEDTLRSRRNSMISVRTVFAQILGGNRVLSPCSNRIKRSAESSKRRHSRRPNEKRKTFNTTD